MPAVSSWSKTTKLSVSFFARSLASLRLMLLSVVIVMEEIPLNRSKKPLQTASDIYDGT